MFYRASPYLVCFLLALTTGCASQSTKENTTQQELAAEAPIEQQDVLSNDEDYVIISEIVVRPVPQKKKSYR